MAQKLTSVASDEFRSGLADYLEQVRWNGHRFEVTRRGTPYAVMLSLPDYEFLMESLHELIALRKEMEAK